MPPYLRQILVFLAVFATAAGLIIWLVQSLINLYLTVQDIPYMGPILVGVLILVLLFFLGVAAYYLFLFRQPEAVADRPPAPPETPNEKADFTRQTLAAVEAQVAKLQDEVTREALQAKAEAIAKNLTNQRIKLVVFGTGSAGKTSVINALMGREVGSVGPILGTTTAVGLYPWALPGIEEPIEILDSPGILEIGQAGAEREVTAQAQAVAADLLLFVVDADLRQSEFGPLIALAELGKRSLLILNKSDRYTPLEQQTLLARLRQRVQGAIAPEDVVLAAARPEPVPLGSEMVHPTPQIHTVQARIHAILLAEGRSLMLDNALLQSQQLSDEARYLLGLQLDKQAEKVVERFQWIVTAAVFANPLPVVDLLAAAAINAQMVVELGGVYGCQLNLKRGKELAYSLAKTLAGMGLIEGSIQLMTGIMTMVAEVTVVGFLVTAPIQAASAGYLTRVAGRSFIEYFKRDQNWGEGGIQAVVKAQVKRAEQEKWLPQFIQEASRRLFH